MTELSDPVGAMADYLVTIFLRRAERVMTRFKDKEGNPLAVLEWAALLEQEDYARIDYYTDGLVEISTVWIGFPHARPFETMIFGGDRDGWQRRYATKAEAEAGHAALVAELGSG